MNLFHAQVFWVRDYRIIWITCRSFWIKPSFQKKLLLFGYTKKNFELTRLRVCPHNSKTFFWETTIWAQLLAGSCFGLKSPWRSWTRFFRGKNIHFIFVTISCRFWPYFRKIEWMEKYKSEKVILAHFSKFFTPFAAWGTTKNFWKSGKIKVVLSCKISEKLKGELLIKT